MHLAVVCLFSVATATLWVMTKGQSVNGDEAVIGLMALKISQGKDFPLFFWKAHYAGPIASYLAAPLHWIWEPSARLLHAAVIPFHVFYCCGVYLLAHKWLDPKAALIAGLLAALPTRLFPYSALGGYMESISILPWFFLLCLGESNADCPDAKRKRAFGGGVLAGLALWIFPISLPAVAAGLVLIPRALGKSNLKRVMLGALAALVPAIAYNLVHPGATFLRLLSRPVGFQRQGLVQTISGEGWLAVCQQAISHWLDGCYHSLANLPGFTSTLFGLSSGGTLWASAAGFVGLIGFSAGLFLCHKARKSRNSIPGALFASVAFTYAFVLLFGMDRYRYLIPVLIILPFGTALMITQGLRSLGAWGMGIAVCIVLLLNGLGNLHEGDKPPDLQRLSSFLEAHGLPRGYAKYDLAYPLTYLSNERLIFTPALHDPKSDRNAKYTQMVTESDKPVYLFDELAAATRFRHSLAELGIPAREETIGGYSVFFDVQRRLNPGEIQTNGQGRIPHSRFCLFWISDSLR
ncbi:MAG: hypothetical protein AB1512_09865 [Thermodesulfobacteriota bacterium]